MEYVFIKHGIYIYICVCVCVCVCDLVILKFFCKVLSVRANMKGNLFRRETSGTQAIRGLGETIRII